MPNGISRCIARTGTARANPSSRRSNITIVPASSDIPVKCSDSKSGHAHVDVRRNSPIGV